MKNANKTIAFDVDGTLIHSLESSADQTLFQTPRYDVVAMYNLFEKLGFTMYIWSGSGVDYATNYARKLGLKGRVVVKGSFQPDIAVDDQTGANLGKVNIYV